MDGKTEGLDLYDIYVLSYKQRKSRNLMWIWISCFCQELLILGGGGIKMFEFSSPHDTCKREHCRYRSSSLSYSNCPRERDHSWLFRFQQTCEITIAPRSDINAHPVISDEHTIHRHWRTDKVICWGCFASNNIIRGWTPLLFKYPPHAL